MTSEPITNTTIPIAVPRWHADFGDLVRKHQSMVFSIALSFLRNHAIAEEIAQDVFLELHRALPTLESPEHVLYWLRRVVTHRSLDTIRRSRPTLAMADVQEPSIPAIQDDEILQAQLRKLVASLPPRARMAMVLRYQEGLGSREIASILDIPEQTVKSRIHRSIGFLREKLTRTLRNRHE